MFVMQCVIMPVHKSDVFSSACTRAAVCSSPCIQAMYVVAHVHKSAVHRVLYVVKPVHRVLIVVAHLVCLKDAVCSITCTHECCMW